MPSGVALTYLSISQHTPFPSSEIYRILPVRREILLGILHCDLIGFHTYDYARHFLSSCTRILGLPTMPNGVELEGHYAHVGTFPIGIEPGQFSEVGRSSAFLIVSPSETDFVALACFNLAGSEEAVGGEANQGAQAAVRRCQADCRS